MPGGASLSAQCEQYNVGRTYAASTRVVHRRSRGESPLPLWEGEQSKQPLLPSTPDKSLYGSDYPLLSLLFISAFNSPASFVFIVRNSSSLSPPSACSSRNFDIIILDSEMSLAARSRYLRATATPKAVIAKITANRIAASDKGSNASFISTGHPWGRPPLQSASTQGQ